MKKLMTICAVVTMLLAVSTGAFATPVDLSNLPGNPIREEYTQVFEGQTSPYDWTRIAFDYDFHSVGNHVPYTTAGEIQIKRYQTAAYSSWMMQMNFDTVDSLFVVDTDYGVYAAPLAGFGGEHHYEFMLNRSNGLWTMALDGVEQTFKAASISAGVLDGVTHGTATPQPDGTAVAVGDTVANKYFSDESYTSIANAVGLGWATVGDPPDHLHGNASGGVGGVGDWKLYFAEATGNSVDNITMSNVPEPLTMAGLALGIGSLATYIRRRKA